MASRMTRENERNIRSSDFLQESRLDFDRNDFFAAQSVLLKTNLEATGDLREEQISRDGGARQQYDIAAEANAVLEEVMRDVADLAPTLEGEIEGIEEKFRMPRSGGKRGRIARARAFAADALPHEAIFIQRGMEANFIELLNTRADRLEQALAAAVSETAHRVGSTSTIIQTHQSSNKIITALDPIVRKRYRQNPAKLAAWKFASHVERDEKPKPKPIPPA
ncbi:hypothetical protein BH10ACI1_BH10ACI1_32110 [soil metagenome]